MLTLVSWTKKRNTVEVHVYLKFVYMYFFILIKEEELEALPNLYRLSMSLLFRFTHFLSDRK